MRVGFVTFEGMGYEDAIAAADEFGFDYLELQMSYIAARSPRLGREYLDEHAGAIRDALGEHGVDLVVHLPHTMEIGATSPIVRRAAIEETEACVGVAADLGAEKAVIHPTTFARPRVWDEDVLREKILASIRELDASSRDAGVELCMENLYRGPFTIHDFEAFFAETECAMTLDTGHARVCGMRAPAVEAFVREHGERISHVHLNDNKAFVVGPDENPADDHVPTGSGDLDIATVVGALDDGSWEGTLSLEMHTQNFDYVGFAKEQFEAAR